MAEIGVTIARLDLRNQPPLLGQRLPLEGHGIERLVLPDRMDVHVGERGGGLLGGHESLVEQLAATDLVDHRLRNDVARAVVHGVLPQHFGIEGPVLHQLRRQLHEIALDLREAAVLHVVEEEMQRMAEFVKERLRLVERQQRRRAAHRPREVADDRHHGRHAPPFGVVGLLHVVAAPRTLALALAREEIEIEHAEVRLVGIEHLVGRHVGMIDRHDDGPEGNAVQPVGQEEDTAPDVLQREVGTQHRLVERILLAAELLGVVPPVPRGELPFGHILAEQLLQLAQLALRPFQRRSPDAFEQLIDRVGRTGHLVVHDIGRIGRVAQQVRLLRAQADEVVDQLFVVVLVAVISAVQVGLVDPLAQPPVGRVGKERDEAGFVEREDARVLLFSPLAGLLARELLHVGGQTGHLVGREFHLEAVVLGEQVVAELHRSERQLAVDLLQAGLPPGVEQRPGAHEAPVGLLQQAQLHIVQIQRPAPVVQLLHAGEKPFVEQNPVVMRRQQRHRPLLQGLQLGGVLRSAEHTENQLRPGEHPSRGVVRFDDVPERRVVVVRRDGVDLGIVQRHAPLEGGQEVFGTDLIEGRHAVGRLPGGEKGILPLRLFGFAGYAGHNQKKCQ